MFQKLVNSLHLTISNLYLTELRLVIDWNIICLVFYFNERWSDLPWDFFWPMFWHSFCLFLKCCWHIFLTCFPAFLLTYLWFFLAYFFDLLFGISCDMFSIFFLKELLTFCLTICQHFVSHFFGMKSLLKNCLTIFLAYIFGMAFLLSFDTLLQVWQATLNSQDRGWGPETPHKDKYDFSISLSWLPQLFPFTCWCLQNVSWLGLPPATVFVYCFGFYMVAVLYWCYLICSLSGSAPFIFFMLVFFGLLSVRSAQPQFAVCIPFSRDSLVWVCGMIGIYFSFFPIINGFFSIVFCYFFWSKK